MPIDRTRLATCAAKAAAYADQDRPETAALWLAYLVALFDSTVIDSLADLLNYPPDQDIAE